jgi:hypothetical protein
MHFFWWSEEKLGVIRLELFSSSSDPSGEGNGALGVPVGVEAEAERGDAMVLVLCEVHQLLAESEVHKTQFSEDVECLVWRCLEETKLGSEGIGGSGEATCFCRWQRKGPFEGSLNLFCGGVAMKQDGCKLLELVVSDFIRAVERKGKRKDERWIRGSSCKAMEVRDFTGEGYERVEENQLWVFSGLSSGLVGDGAGERAALDQRIDEQFNFINRDSSIRADKVEAEDGWIDLGDGFGIKVARVEGQGDAKLPRVFSKVGWASAIDEGAKFGMEAISRVEDKVGICSVRSAGGLFDSSKEGYDIVARMKASRRGCDVLREINFKFGEGSIRCRTAGSGASSSKGEDSSIRKARNARDGGRGWSRCRRCGGGGGGKRGESGIACCRVDSGSSGQSWGAGSLGSCVLNRRGSVANSRSVGRAGCGRGKGRSHATGRAGVRSHASSRAGVSSWRARWPFRRVGAGSSGGCSSAAGGDVR